MPNHNEHIFEFDGIGTHWWITTGKKLSDHVKDGVLDTVQIFEADYSRFRETSLIGKLNTEKKLSTPPQELVDILNTAADFYQSTNGIFDIRVGAKLEQLGYGLKNNDTSSGRDASLVEVDKYGVKIGNFTHLDLGGIGKGWLIDKLARQIADHIPSFTINGGGDMYIHGAQQTVLLEHPMIATQGIGEIQLKDYALAASSPLKRAWHKNGKQHHHIINPASGSSETKFIASFVTAKSTTLADVMATALLLSSEAIRAQLTQIYTIDYLLIKPDFGYIKSKNFSGTIYT